MKASGSYFPRSVRIPYWNRERSLYPTASLAIFPSECPAATNLRDRHFRRGRLISHRPAAAYIVPSSTSATARSATKGCMSLIEGNANQVSPSLK